VTHSGTYRCDQRNCPGVIPSVCRK
jgi:hypothetical protein